MAFKLLLVLLAFFSLSNAQSLSCEFWRYDATVYICELTINNTNSYDAFTSIPGTHEAGSTNAQVTQLTTAGLVSTNFPRIICNTFNNLDTINFGFLGTTSISDFSFAGCPNLFHLDLYSNSINSISANAFANNRQLAELSLANNQLLSLPSNLFVNQHALTYLELNRNMLTDLPATFFQGMTNLKNVRLMNNNLANWHAMWFQNHPRLEYVDVGYNRFTAIPMDAFDATNQIETLWVDNNQLRELRISSFRNVQPLTSLHAADNFIEFIDRALLETPPNLYYVDLFNNLCTNEFFSNFNQNRTIYLNALAACF